MELNYSGTIYIYGGTGGSELTYSQIHVLFVRGQKIWLILDFMKSGIHVKMLRVVNIEIEWKIVKWVEKKKENEEKFLNSVEGKRGKSSSSSNEWAW